MARKKSKFLRKTSEIRRKSSATVRTVKVISKPQFKSKRFKSVYKTRELVTPMKLHPEIVKKVERFKEGRAFKRRFRYLQEGMKIVDALTKKKKTRPKPITRKTIKKREKIGYVSPRFYRKAIFGTERIPIYYPIRGPLAAYQLIRFSTSELRFLRTGRPTKFTLIEIAVSDKGLEIWEDYCTWRHISMLDWKKELKMLASRLRNMLIFVSDLYINKYEQYVPEETGELKRTLRASLYSGYIPPDFPTNIKELHLLINFGSNLPYFNYLQKPTLKVRHEASEKIMSRRTHRYLHDPKALHGFYGLIQTNLRVFLSGKFQELVRETASILSISWHKARSFWTVRGLR